MTALEQAAGSRTLRLRALAPHRTTTAATVFCLLSFTAFWAAQQAANVSMIDLMVYRAEGWTVRTGGDLYAMRATEANLPTTYPPFAALLFTPLTLLGVPELRALATVVNLALLVAFVHLSLRLIGGRRHLPRAAVTLTAAAVAVWCEPVWTTLRYGQVNLLLGVLVLRDLAAREGRRWAGAGIGIAAGIKLTPALFVVCLALAGALKGAHRLRTHRGSQSPRRAIATVWNPLLRQATVACAAFLGTAVAAAVVLPHDSRRFWTGTLFAAGRAGYAEDTANQSIRGVLARLLHTGHPDLSWTVAAAAVAVAGLAIAVAALLTGRSAWAAVSCAVTALLVSPVSWSHHWVWCVPLVLLLGCEALRRGSAAWWAGTAAAGLLFSSYALWWVPHGPGLRAELHQSWGQMALSAVYPSAGAAFLALAGAVAVGAVRGRRRPQAVAKE